MSRRLPARALYGVLALASACAAETVELPPPAPAHFQPRAIAAASPTTPTERERGVAQAYAHAMGSPSLEGLPALFAEDVHLECGDRDTRGRDRVVKRLQELFSAFDQKTFTISSVWLMDSTQVINSQAIEWTLSGVQTGDWMGIPPTHHAAVIRGLTLLWIDDGGIASEVHVYFDEDAVKAQLADKQAPPVSSEPPAHPEVTQHSGSIEESSNVAVARGILRALQDDQESAFVASFAEAAEVTTIGRNETVRGRAGARSSFRAIRKSIRQLDTVFHNAWGVGRFAIVEYTLAGLQTASSSRTGAAPGGSMHPLQLHCVDVDELEAGKITHIRRYVDRSLFGAIVGASRAATGTRVATTER